MTMSNCTSPASPGLLSPAIANLPVGRIVALFCLYSRTAAREENARRVAIRKRHGEEPRSGAEAIQSPARCPGLLRHFPLHAPWFGGLKARRNSRTNLLRVVA